MRPAISDLLGKENVCQPYQASQILGMIWVIESCDAGQMCWKLQGLKAEDTLVVLHKIIKHLSNREQTALGSLGILSRVGLTPTILNSCKFYTGGT